MERKWEVSASPPVPAPQSHSCQHTNPNGTATLSSTTSPFPAPATKSDHMAFSCLQLNLHNITRLDWLRHSLSTITTERQITMLAGTCHGSKASKQQPEMKIPLSQRRKLKLKSAQNAASACYASAISQESATSRTIHLQDLPLSLHNQTICGRRTKRRHAHGWNPSLSLSPSPCKIAYGVLP